MEEPSAKKIKLTSMPAKELFESIGIYACEKHFVRTIEALSNERASYVVEESRLLFELREHLLKFKTENTPSIVVLIARIHKRFGNVLSDRIVNVMFFAKAMDALAIVRLATKVDVFVLSSFTNAINTHFPEDYPSDKPASEKLFKNMRQLLLFQSRNLKTLKKFGENEVEDRWTKFEANFKEHSFLLIEEGFKAIQIVRGTTEVVRISEHMLWKEFQRYFKTKESQETDETLKTFVDFIKDKLSRNSK